MLQFSAADPDAAADPHRGDLSFTDQLVGPAASDPQDLRDLRDLHVLVLLLVHPHPRLSVAFESMLMRPVEVVR
jgi:hypothetical protein